MQCSDGKIYGENKRKIIKCDQVFAFNARWYICLNADGYTFCLKYFSFCLFVKCFDSLLHSISGKKRYSNVWTKPRTCTPQEKMTENCCIHQRMFLLFILIPSSINYINNGNRSELIVGFTTKLIFLWVEHKGLTDCGNRLFFGCRLQKNCKNTVRISEIIFKVNGAQLNV